MLETRKHQFVGLVIILLIIGFLNYFRRIVDGHKFTKYGKILYIVTMTTFVIGIMFVLYFTETNNIISFLIGLLVATTSEHIAQMLLTIGNNFNIIVVKIIKKFTGLDFSKELIVEQKDEKSNS